MKPIAAARKFIRKQIQKAFDPMADLDLNKIIGWRSVGGSSAYGYYQDNQYENGYSSISKLGNGFAQVEQYTIDKDAKGVASNILDRLYTPNTDMSAYDFREALAVCFLVMDKVRIKVHHKTTRITPESITGFTFMEGYSETIVGGKRQYQMPNGETLTDKEVITLKSVNPNNVNDGFSASRAAKRWTKLDDLIADYQRGYFANGAVPAGEMIITARTPAEFNDIVDKLEEKHQGAGRNNNITYTHRPTNQNGEPMNAQIEWVPFSTGNKDMALKDLFENVNKKIDSSYGVPAEIRGFLSNSNYASVGVAEKVFVKYALYPMTMKIWTKFTHELNRITGGTGVAIAFDLPIPSLADEELVKAEAKKVEGETVANLTAQGITIESAVEYVQTGDVSILAVGPKDDDDRPDVLSPEEAKDTPEQPIDIYSKSLKKMVTKQPMTVPDGHTRCICCQGLGEHYNTGFECYRCDAAGSVNAIEARQPVPCDGYFEDGGDSHKILDPRFLYSQKQISARDIPDLYEGMDIDVDQLGCIMMNTKTLPILKYIDNPEADMVTDGDEYSSGAVAETKAHVTLLFGLLENGNVWKDKVDAVLDGWDMKTVKIEKVSYFETPDGIAIIGLVEKSAKITDGHERLTLLPHISTFSEYHPHITLAWVKPDKKIANKWVNALGEAYNGKVIKTTGLNYGDKPAAKKALKAKAMSNTTRQEYEAELAAVVRKRMEVQVDNVIKNYDGITKAISVDDPIEAIEDALLSSEMQTVLVSLISFQGDLEHEINTQIILRAGISDENVAPFRMTAAQRKKYNAYVDKVAEGYNAETSEKIRQIIRLGRENDLTAAEIKRNLRSVLDEEYRITRIAVSEVNRAGNTSSLYSMQEIADQTGASVEKIWEHSGGDDPCEFCRAMIGTTVPLNENFLDMDASVRGVDGGEFINNFVPIDVAELHPNGHCRQTYRVRR